MAVFIIRATISLDKNQYERACKEGNSPVETQYLRKDEDKNHGNKDP